MSERMVAFEGIENFRDFGGYATTTGARMRSGILFRSAHHAEASSTDLARLSALDLSVIIDLRRAEERETEPSRRWPDFAGQVIENNIPSTLPEYTSVISGPSEATVDSWESYLFGWYRGALNDERHIELFRRYFRSLAGTNGAVLVHCTAGKDRTGLICALTHYLAGVHEDDIVNEYLLTNDEARIRRRVKILSERFQARSDTLPSEAILRSIASVKPDYLHTAFATVRESHGGLDEYLSEALGVNAKLREKLLARLLE